MCASAGQILSTWLAAPSQVDAQYRAFLDTFGGKKGLAPVSVPLPDGSRGESVYPAILQWAETKAVIPPHVSACDVFHSGEHRACWTHFAKFTGEGILRAARMYAALHTVFLLIQIARRTMRREPTDGDDGDDKSRSSSSSAPRRFVKLLWASLPALAIRIAKSSLFLSLYCSSAWLTACLAYKYVYSHVSRATLASHTWFAGVPVLLEAPSRQLELASYCAVYAVDITWRQLNAIFGRSTARPDLVVGALIFSAAVLMHNHRQHGQFISGWLLQLDNSDDDVKQIAIEKQQQSKSPQR